VNNRGASSKNRAGVRRADLLVELFSFDEVSLALHEFAGQCESNCCSGWGGGGGGDLGVKHRKPCLDKQTLHYALRRKAQQIHGCADGSKHILHYGERGSVAAAQHSALQQQSPTAACACKKHAPRQQAGHLRWH
jgi:hypothetical protein